MLKFEARKAARTKTLTPSAAPICPMNYWLVIALPMRSAFSFP
jgi:hypothetical protein